MQPQTGDRLLRFVGDRVWFSVRTADGTALPTGWRVLLRTNLGRAPVLRQNIIASYPARPRLAMAEWHDLPLRRTGTEWSTELMLTEPGFFKAKAYAVDPQGRQHWPEGGDAGVSVHPDAYRTGNTIYCAFVRMFGETLRERSTQKPALDAQLAPLDERRFAVIPPSGKLRDLIRHLPHIFDTLGCRILHLLPVNPTPTTLARFGRFGSPYAALDLTAVDPALVTFDRQTTGLDQFCELTRAVHARGGRVFLDVVINHTGWGARLQEEHPEWYLRRDGQFVSPGAWGMTWEDLSELNHEDPALWRHLAEVFLTWCRRGVDGFRCDAGYKVPVPTWRYIVARVQEEFPDTIFLLEGLGGALEATESLLTEGLMQWAYSELFQNYDAGQVSNYLDYALRQCERVGLYVHYSETHDNARLAARGREWSLLRNRLCALTSASGGFGFTAGVEWLADEKIQVHESRGLSWDNPDNLVPELAHLNRLLSQHPCFFDGARLVRLSPPGAPVYALSRHSAEGVDHVLVLVNTDVAQSHTLVLEAPKGPAGPAHDFYALFSVDLLEQPLPSRKRLKNGRVEIAVPAGAAYCLAPTAQPAGLSGEAYRTARAQAAWGLSALNQLWRAEDLGPCDWRDLAALVDQDPAAFLASVTAAQHFRIPAEAGASIVPQLQTLMGERQYWPVALWQVSDCRRILLVPPCHWLLIQHDQPFQADLDFQDGRAVLHTRSIRVRTGHVAFVSPQTDPAEAVLRGEWHVPDGGRSAAAIRFLPLQPEALPCPTPHIQPQPAESLDGRHSAPLTRTALGTANPSALRASHGAETVQAESWGWPKDALVLLTNGRGGMARMCVDLGRITSKYDCLLGANLHPSFPVDRHILAKRLRAWLFADGFVATLGGENLVAFDPGPPATWRFVASAGDGRAVELQLTAEMLPERNTVRLVFHRPQHLPALGLDLPAACAVSLTVRIDLEDRNFHWETKRNPDSDRFFADACHNLQERVGFKFAPAPDRQLQVVADRGHYHPQAEWCQGIPHSVEATRGMVGEGDAFSPGWFELPLGKGESATLMASAELGESDLRMPEPPRQTPDGNSLSDRLERAARAFVVRRDDARTVIAGYPWFLDWGRDTLIAARGLLAAGWTDEVLGLLKAFGRFEENGTLPNTIHGHNASNRDTSDAPLWYGIACEEFAALGENAPASDQGTAAPARPELAGAQPGFYQTRLDDRGRTILEVLVSIATHYTRGTPHGIRMDPVSGLIWSPSHFTWMDTNFPAGTPRAGYPVEIQALWIRLLRQLARLGLPSTGESWETLANRAQESFLNLFWLEKQGWLSDVLLGPAGTPAAQAVPDTALRSNGLFAVSFGILSGKRACQCVAAATRHLLVPGALRSLAPLPVSPPLPIYAPDGRLLNNPHEPYWGRYEGAEDTRRKPAYHNGTAWSWTLPTFCEALARAWDFSPCARRAARAYLGSIAPLLDCGCLGQLPEILDGDAPHQPRGCDAQAWSVTEALRVWKML